MLTTPVSTEPAVMRLAHPLRCAAATPDFGRMFRELLGEAAWAELGAEFRREGELTNNLVMELCDRPQFRILRKMTGMLHRMDGGTEVGNAMAIMLYLRQMVSPQPYFVLDDALCELLSITDIAEDIPVGMLTMPFPRFYLEFGKNRTLGLSLPNIETGDHLLEGCYLEKGSHPDFGEGLFLMLTGSPLGKENAMDDATHSLFLPMNDPEMSLRDALHWTYGQAQKVARDSGLRETPKDMLDSTFQSLLFLAKALLYLGLAEARKEVHKDHTAWKKSFDGLQSTAKRAKAAKRGRGLVDHVLVLPPARAAAAPTGTGAGAGVTLKGHVRRGHLRMQAYGPQYSLHRIRLILPTDVNGGPEDDAPRQYLVR